MDPKATVNAMLDALATGDMGDARDFADALFEWVFSGGFVPAERL